MDVRGAEHRRHDGDLESILIPDHSLTTMWAMVISGGCASISGLMFATTPWLLVPALGVWGVAVIADSAQFSAALSQAADQRYVGTALTAQIAIGFLITVVTIRLLPIISSGIGCRWALTALALGPASGALAMRRLILKRADRSGSTGPIRSQAS